MRVRLEGLSSSHRDRFRGLRFLLALVVFTIGGSPARAAEVPTVPNSERTESRSWLDRLGRDLAAPVLQPGRNYLITGSVLTVLSLPLKKPSRDIAEDQPLGKSSAIGYRLGFWQINLAYIVGALGYGLAADDAEAIRKSTLMLRATVYTGLMTTGLKELKLEERPRKNGDFNSFPSGHASNAFAFAGVIYRNHGPGLGWVALGGAAFVAFSRINDNAHYPNDVIFGAALGLSYALGLDASWSATDGSRAVAVAPFVRGDSAGLGAVIDF